MDELEISKRKANKFACVRFKDQVSSEYHIVPIESVKEKRGKNFKDFAPSHEDDFVKNTFYYVYYRVNFASKTGNHDERYHKAHVLYLGESESDVKNKITAKRVKFPNKKYCHLSSSTDIECSVTASQEKAKIIQKELTNRVQDRKNQKAEEELVTFYGQKQLESRANIVDSDSDNDNPEQTKPDLEQQTILKQKPGGPCKITKIEKITKKHHPDNEGLLDEEHPEHLDDDSMEVPMRKRTNTNKRQDEASTSSKLKSDEVELDLEQQTILKQKPGGPCKITKIEKITKKHHLDNEGLLDEEHPEHLDDDSMEIPMRKSTNTNKRRDEASTSSILKSDEVELDSQRTSRRGSREQSLTITSRRQIGQQDRDNDTDGYRHAHRVVQASTSQEKAHTRNIRAPDLAHLTDAPSPKRLKKRQVSNKGIVTECHGLRRFDVVNGKIYLGLDVFVGKDSWANTMGQKPQTFIRDAATIIWQEEGILNRCFDTGKISVSFRGRSPRKQFEADKLQLLRDLLDYYLEYNRYSRHDRIKYKMSMNTTLGQFVQDIRKPYKHLVRKQLLYPE